VSETTPPGLSDANHFPPPFHEVARPRARYWFAGGLLFCACVIVANVLRDNELAHPAPASFWQLLLQIKIIGNDAAMTLFAALLAGLLGYYQFYLAQSPHLTYNCVRTHTVTFDRTTQGKYWTTILRNSGGGPARVIGVRYEIRLRSGATLESGHYAETMAFLRANGLREGTDFVLFRLSPGETIRAGGDWLILEVDMARAFESVIAIDISIYVTGIAGGRFQRDIYCVPRRWIDDGAPLERLPQM
jgi:hypothetical protein